MKTFHHHKLPDHSTLLSGPQPRDEYGFISDKLQIWYNNTSEAREDSSPHLHTQSDEIFILLKGSISVEVDGQRFEVGPREFCCFPAGVTHSVEEVHPPVESLMIRAPAVSDKVYPPQNSAP